MSIELYTNYAVRIAIVIVGCILVTRLGLNLINIFTYILEKALGLLR